MEWSWEARRRLNPNKVFAECVCQGNSNRQSGQVRWFSSHSNKQIWWCMWPHSIARASSPIRYGSWQIEHSELLLLLLFIYSSEIIMWPNCWTAALSAGRTFGVSLVPTLNVSLKARRNASLRSRTTCLLEVIMSGRCPDLLLLPSSFEVLMFLRSALFLLVLWLSLSLERNEKGLFDILLIILILPSEEEDEDGLGSLIQPPSIFLFLFLLVLSPLWSSLLRDMGELGLELPRSSCRPRLSPSIFAIAKWMRMITEAYYSSSVTFESYRKWHFDQINRSNSQTTIQILHLKSALLEFKRTFIHLTLIDKSNNNNIPWLKVNKCIHSLSLLDL